MSEYRIEAEITQGQGPGRFVPLLEIKKLYQYMRKYLR